MKKLALCAIIILAVTGVVFSQGMPYNGVSQTTAFEGTLQLVNGQIALVNGNNVYFVPALERYIGFIEGIKEGNRVSVEGFIYGNTLQPVKMTVGGNSYDLIANNLNYYNGYGCCSGGNYAMPGRYGMGRGGMRGW